MRAASPVVASGPEEEEEEAEQPAESENAVTKIPDNIQKLLDNVHTLIDNSKEIHPNLKVIKKNSIKGYVEQALDGKPDNLNKIANEMMSQPKPGAKGLGIALLVLGAVILLTAIAAAAATLAGLPLAIGVIAAVVGAIGTKLAIASAVVATTFGAGSVVTGGIFASKGVTRDNNVSRAVKDMASKIDDNLKGSEQTQQQSDDEEMKQTTTSPTV